MKKKILCITMLSLVISTGVHAQYFDEETGLNYNGFRYYDPNGGRYLQSDPVGQLGGLNTYLYVLANPLRWTDPLGLWSPGAHDKIFDHAFGENLSAADLARLQQSSREFDKKHQGSDESYMHSMAQKNQDVAEALRRRNEFIRDTLEEARKLAMDGKRNAALDKLGEACHPVMDSSSPMHKTVDGRPKVWNPLWPFGHSPNDSIGNETVNDLTLEILNHQDQLLNYMYNKVFEQ